MPFNRLIQTGLIATVSLVLVSCGGAGGGSGGNSTSSTLINGISVPPDPGAAAASTVVGIDTNNNGVRDEVERKIATTYGANPSQYAGAMRAAKAFQAYLAANGDPTTATSVTTSAVIAGACLLEQYGNDPIAANKAANYIFALTLDTASRVTAYRATKVASTETATSIPSQPCQ